MKKKLLCCVFALCFVLSLISLAFASNFEKNVSRAANYTSDSYAVYYKPGMTTPWSTLAGYLNTAETLLENEFDIYLTRLFASTSTALNERAGCTRGSSSLCDSVCGAVSSCATLHHKNATHFLYCMDSYDAKIFRFVDFKLCRYSGGNHGEVYGMASGDDSDIIVSLTAPYIQRTVLHELSHWFGARDNDCVDGQPCVMRYSSPVDNRWCDNCEEAIREYLILH